MGPSWLQNSPRASTLPHGFVMQHRPVHICARASAAAFPCKPTAVAPPQPEGAEESLSSGTSSKEAGAIIPSERPASQEGGRRPQRLSSLGLGSLVPHAASQDTDGPWRQHHQQLWNGRNWCRGQHRRRGQRRSGPWLGRTEGCARGTLADGGLLLKRLPKLCVCTCASTQQPGTVTKSCG